MDRQTIQGRKKADKKDPDKVGVKEQKEENKHIFVPFMRYSTKSKEKPKANQKGNKGKNKYPFLADWGKLEGKQKFEFKFLFVLRTEREGLYRRRGKHP